MKISQTGINLIKEFEGCRLDAYKCPAGVWTIGYGHTGGVKQGQTVTQAQADEYLKKDLEKFEKHVGGFSKYKWNQNQFDALVSFAFNVGSISQLTANGTRSTAQISAKITAYNKAAGKELAGLTRRRRAEKELFDTPAKGTAGDAKKTVDEIAKEVIGGKWGNGNERKAALEAAGHDYKKVQARVNELAKAAAAETAASALKKGDKVKIRQGAKDANTGTGYAGFVYKKTYRVHSVSGSYVVFGDGKTATGKTEKGNVTAV